MRKGTKPAAGAPGLEAIVVGSGRGGPSRRGLLVGVGAGELQPPGHELSSLPLMCCCDSGLCGLICHLPVYSYLR